MYSKRFTQLTPYTPGEQPQDKKYIKLNTNENPFPPSPAVIEAISTFDQEKLRLYPEPNCSELRAAIAEYHGVSVENIFVGNGSDEVLSMIYYAFFDSSYGPLQMPDLSFSFYPVFADFHGVAIRQIPLKDDFTLDLSQYTKTGQSCGTIFANPNAPTGLPIARDAVAQFLDEYNSECIVVSDEAYTEFGGESTLPLLERHSNLIIVNTCSKSRSLAGARLGYAIASKELINALFSVKNSFNSYTVNALTQAIGIAAFRSNGYYAEINKRVISIRDSFISTLQKYGWEVLPSKANFIFTKLPGKSGESIYKDLRNSGILVRYFNMDRIKDFIRISVGNEDEMTRVAAAVKEMATSAE